MNWRTGFHHYRKKTTSHSFAGMCQLSWLSLWLSSKQVFHGLLAGVDRWISGYRRLWVTWTITVTWWHLCVSCRGSNISQIHERFTLCWIKTKWMRNLHSSYCTTVLMGLHCSEESLCVCSMEISSQLQSMMQSHCSEALQLLQLANTGLSLDVSESVVHLASVYMCSDWVTENVWQSLCEVTVKAG